LGDIEIRSAHFQNMQTNRRAVIDVGTNSIKLLVADVSDGVVQPVLEESEQTRLGAGFYETNRLQPQAIAQTAQAVASFVGKARELQAVSGGVDLSRRAGLRPAGGNYFRRTGGGLGIPGSDHGP
jgi:hypothetical protein